MSHPDARRRLWPVVGGLALAHVALMFAGFAFTPVARLGSSTGAAVAAYHGSSRTAAGIGSAISLLGFVAFLCAALLLARLLRGETETSRWMAGVCAAAGSLYVGLTFALPYSASGLARYGAQHGMARETVAAFSDLHWFGDDMATVMLGVFTVSVAVAVWITRALPRWVAIGGIVAGVCCLGTAGFPPEDVLDDVTLIWIVWFVVLAVAALRAGRIRTVRPPATTPVTPGAGHLAG
jgi:hypothetical protein